jgi:hypothetical protein
MPKFSDKVTRTDSASACATPPTEPSRRDSDQMNTTADLQRIVVETVGAAVPGDAKIGRGGHDGEHTRHRFGG